MQVRAVRQRLVTQQTEQIAIDHAERRGMALARQPRCRDLEVLATVAIEHGEALIGEARAHAGRTDLQGDKIAQQVGHHLDVGPRRVAQRRRLEDVHARAGQRRRERRREPRETGADDPHVPNGGHAFRPPKRACEMQA